MFSSTSTCWSCCIIVVSDAPLSCCLLLPGPTEARNRYIYDELKTFSFEERIEVFLYTHTHSSLNCTGFCMLLVCAFLCYLFVWLISHSRKYYWLIYYERKNTAEWLVVISLNEQNGEQKKLVINKLAEKQCTSVHRSRRARRRRRAPPLRRHRPPAAAG